ncbi:KAT8 regulatory NSL complex subunit 1-like protein isoform 2-T2 [Acanthopagrus schlegelii]
MAPALTRTLKDGHGIHLSSPPASVRMDTDFESQLRSTDDADLQKMWLNLSLCSPLDSCLPVSPLDIPANPVFSPCPQASASQRDAVLLPSSASLPDLLSFGEGLRDSHQVASVFPGVPDMFLVAVPEHNSQVARLLHGCSAAPECGPDGGDVHHSPLTLTIAPPLYCNREINYQDFTRVYSSILTQENVARIGCPPLSSVQPCSSRVNTDQPVSRVVLEEAVKEQLSRQAGLHSRAQRLQRRLQALLGEHALLHCQQQLEGLKRHCQHEFLSLDSPDPIHPDILPPQVGCKPHFPQLDLSTGSSSFMELREFSLSNQAVLRGLQEALDSEATASSSSDEEKEELRIHGKINTSPVNSSSSSYERRWLEERAELGSRWSWLNLRLAELEGRIQQLVELHKHIRSTKGGVVLAESQPLTDRQIQQTLLREMAGLSCTASDADTEPCSPARLLRNIERQSAQLSQIVNSLMTPLSFSPLSKPPHTWKGKRAFASGQTGHDAFVPGSSKKRRLGSRRLFKADASCVCARTRPLVTYHKPKLFALSTYNPHSAQDSGTSMSTLSSSLSSSSCSCWSSCDPVVLCSDPDCSSNSSGALSSRTTGSTPHPALSLSFDTPLSDHIKAAQAREEWSLKPLVVNVHPSSAACYNRRSSTPLHNSHKYKQRGRHHKSRVMVLSPIGMAGSAKGQHRRANQRKRKRRRISRLIEEEENVLYQLCDTEDSSDEVLEESYTQIASKRASQGFVRKRQGVSEYNINNIVIPMTAAKVEKLQYKDILTPSWRLVDTLPLINREAEKVEDSEEGQVEDLTDEIMAQRHLALEQSEKMRWGSWGKRKCCRRPNRSGSRLSGSGGGMCTSGEESSVELSSCAQLDTDEQQSSEEWLPQTPWEPRVFPLDEHEEEALLSADQERVSSGWSECSRASTTSKNSNSHLSPARSSGATLPSGGQSKSRTPDGS